MKGKAKKQAVKNRIAIRHMYMHKPWKKRIITIFDIMKPKFSAAMMSLHSGACKLPFQQMAEQRLTTQIK